MSNCNFTIVTSITRPDLFRKRLLRSLELLENNFIFIATPSKLPISTSYNSIGNVNTDYVMFVHQDIVFLEDGKFLSKAKEICDKLPNFGIGGCGGCKIMKEEGGRTKYIRIVGSSQKYECRAKIFNQHIRSYEEKVPFEQRKYEPTDKLFWDGNFYLTKKSVCFSKSQQPIELQTLDGGITIIPKEAWNKRKFDENFPFHHTVLNYSLEVQHFLGLKAYLLPLNLWRLSSFSREIHEVDDPFLESFKRLGNKWRPLGKCPILTYMGIVV